MLKRIIGRIAAAAISVSLYLPIIAGLISQMVWVLAGWYFSWDLLSYIVPFSDRWGGFFPIFPDVLQVGISVAFRFSQILIFCFGLFLLCYGLVILVKARASQEGLVTSGPYHWVRHPQHLGILLMLFLLAFPLQTSYSHLLNPVIRPGDLISMSSVLFLLILVADLEDYRLRVKFRDVYNQYQQNTPFILPVRIQLPKSLHFNKLARGRPLRYIVATLFFWGFLVLLSYYFTFVPLIFTR
jgi:protein-S-isoprenylcysteine O-methyltransferase Ste14